MLLKRELKEVVINALKTKLSNDIIGLTDILETATPNDAKLIIDDVIRCVMQLSEIIASKNTDFICFESEIKNEVRSSDAVDIDNNIPQL